jgi:hypothetical protein
MARTFENRLTSVSEPRLKKANSSQKILNDKRWILADSIQYIVAYSGQHWKQTESSPVNLG